MSRKLTFIYQGPFFPFNFLLWPRTTNWNVLADDAMAIMAVEFGRVTLPLIESIKQ